MAKVSKKKAAPKRVNRKVAKKVTQVLKESPPSAKEDPLLSMREAAKILGVTGPTVGRWVKFGFLACVILPSGLKKVRKSQVDYYLQGKNMEFPDVQERNPQPQ